MTIYTLDVWQCISTGKVESFANGKFGEGGNLKQLSISKCTHDSFKISNQFIYVYISSFAFVLKFEYIKFHVKIFKLKLIEFSKVQGD